MPQTHFRAFLMPRKLFNELKKNKDKARKINSLDLLDLLFICKCDDGLYCGLLLISHASKYGYLSAYHKSVHFWKGISFVIKDQSRGFLIPQTVGTKLFYVKPF